MSLGDSTRRTLRSYQLEALKQYVIPYLESQGFAMDKRKGAEMDFRRFRNDKVQCLRFQFDKNQRPYFRITIGEASREGINIPHRGFVSAEEIKAWMCESACLMDRPRWLLWLLQFAWLFAAIAGAASMVYLLLFWNVVMCRWAIAVCIIMFFAGLFCMIFLFGWYRLRFHWLIGERAARATAQRVIRRFSECEAWWANKSYGLHMIRRPKIEPRRKQLESLSSSENSKNVI